MKRPFRKCMGCYLLYYLHIRIVFELLSCKAHLPELWHFFQNQSGAKRVKLAAIDEGRKGFLLMTDSSPFVSHEDMYHYHAPASL